ncbi:MAG: hypothetical protein HZB16_07395 [Armatimonadetes bacterium]|nr:hypothetical protein [Armatimonadota bacterium]
MRRIVLSLACAALLGGAASAQTDPWMYLDMAQAEARDGAAPKWSAAVSAKGDALSQYTYRGQGLSKHVLSASLAGAVTYDGWLTARLGTRYVESMLAHNALGSQDNVFDASLAAARPEWPVTVTGGWRYRAGQIGANRREAYLGLDSNPKRCKIADLSGEVSWGYNAPYYVVSLGASRAFGFWKSTKVTKPTLSAVYEHTFGPGTNGTADFALRARTSYKLTDELLITPRAELVFPGGGTFESRDVLPGIGVTVAYSPKAW